MTEIPMLTLNDITGSWARHFYGVTAKDGTEYVYDPDKNVVWQDIEGCGWSAVEVSDETLATIDESIKKLRLKV